MFDSLNSPRHMLLNAQQAKEYLGQADRPAWLQAEWLRRQEAAQIQAALPPPPPKTFRECLAEISAMPLMPQDYYLTVGLWEDLFDHDWT
jgi:hypothetical protein